ncbi:tetratricopeptide repeat protein, partial [Thermophilibacter provencensis]|uniref:tetratricopeptide repeat protein n=1 Tax=Thermophilibacter provencensis TaxID=1852386 RepID=UPI003AA8BC81
AGVAAFELDLVPPEAWPRSAFVDGLGLVPATEQMRRRAAGTYNARLAALVAGYALAAAPELGEVWVAGVIDTARDHACLYSARVTREALGAFDLGGSFDPVALLRSCGAAISLDEAGGLVPVRQGFSLDDETLCPRERYDAPELSEATLAGELGDALGCWRVSDLGIDEGARRRHVADELARHLTGSTEKNVQAILAAAREDGHPDVIEAARRCVSGLIDGELEDDALAIGESFVEGSDLQRGCARARDALLSHDLEAAGKYATDALLPIDGLGSFDGSDGLVWRGFGSYADRALYNRLVAAPGEHCALVPAAYLEAHTIAAASALARGRAEEALAHARRAAEVAPLSSQASLNLAQCLEATGDPEAAGRELCRLLSLAHDPESIGLGYLGMAQLQWQGGHVLTAQACYQRATRHLGAPALVARLAMAALIGQVGVSAGGELSPDQADSLLEAAGIPLAPTETVSAAFLEATRAATDAGIFRVARDLLRKLCMISRDDVYFGMLRSVE